MLRKLISTLPWLHVLTEVMWPDRKLHSSYGTNLEVNSVWAQVEFVCVCVCVLQMTTRPSESTVRILQHRLKRISFCVISNFKDTKFHMNKQKPGFTPAWTILIWDYWATGRDSLWSRRSSVSLTVRLCPLSILSTSLTWMRAGSIVWTSFEFFSPCVSPWPLLVPTDLPGV